MAMQATPMNQPSPHGATGRVPFFVSLFNPVARRLLGAGVPLGPNAMITVRGRKTGQSRSTPVAIVDIGGRRWVQSPFGEVNWVRNLRAAREATVTINRRTERVEAVELSSSEKATFFKEVLGPYVRAMRFGRLLAGALGLGDILSDPDGAAQRHPVFELRAGANAGSGSAMGPGA